MAILLFLLWIIWNGKVNAEIILFGVALTALVLLFAVKVLGYSLESERRFWINSPLFLSYTAVLIGEIFKASLAVAGLALSSTRKPDPVIVEFHSGLPSDFQNACTIKEYFAIINYICAAKQQVARTNRNGFKTRNRFRNALRHSV